MIKKIAVIVAAGSGTRMGSETPKQFLLIQNKPVLWYSIAAFQKAFDDIEIRLVVPSGHFGAAEEIRLSAPKPEMINLIAGGETRFESVRNGLYDIADNNAIIFVHDGVRSLVSTSLIRNCFDEAVRAGSAVPVIPVHDSLRIKTDRGNLQVVDRGKIQAVQTPQTFRAEILLPAFREEYHDYFTDESIVVEYSGKAVNFVPGEDSNIKITRPVDLLLAERILAGRDGI